MEKNNRSNNIEKLFENISRELFPEFSSFSSFYAFWRFDSLTNKDDTLQKLNTLYAQYQKIPEQEDSMQNVTPFYSCKDTSDSKAESYNEPFAHLTDIERLQLSQEETYIKDAAQFHALEEKNYTNKQLWTYFIWKYFIEEQNIPYTILASSYNEPDETITVSREEFLSLCTARRNKYKVSKHAICEVDEDNFKKHLNLISNSHPCITRTTGNKFQYPKSMQDAIIEYVAMPYDESNTEYLPSSLQSLKKYLKRNKDASNKDASNKNSKEKQILNWTHNKKYFSFDIFTGANQRLFLENNVNLRMADGWISLTGSLISNCIYKTLLEANEHYGFISSRMDDSILEGLYSCLEKILNICNLNFLEKMKFIQRIYSLIPFFLEKAEKDKSSNNFSSAGNESNETAKSTEIDKSTEADGADKTIKSDDKPLKIIFQSLTNAIEEFNIDHIIEYYSKKLQELNEKNLLSMHTSDIEKIVQTTNITNTALVKMYSQSQKREKDTEKSKNTIFYEKISKGVTYIIYS